MPFQVTDAERLRIEADRLAAILTMRGVHSHPDGTVRVWEEDDFIIHLENIGLFYSSGELVALRDELMLRGVIQ